jgi:hypothetical protein
VQQKPLPVAYRGEYFPPEIDPDREVTKMKRVRRTDTRRHKMGEAKDIVGEIPKCESPNEALDLPVKGRRERKLGALPEKAKGSGVLKELSSVTDRLDRAIEVKLVDLDNEPTQIAENHLKLGLLRGATALIRRAKAMLEDYGKDIHEDMDPAFDAVDMEN